MTEETPTKESQEETPEETPELEETPSEIDAQIEKKIIEPCDPTTMTCDQMRDKIIGLSDERAKYDNTIKKLDEIKIIIPSLELDKIHIDLIGKKKKIDNEIYNTFEKFSICTTTKPKEEKTE